MNKVVPLLRDIDVDDGTLRRLRQAVLDHGRDYARDLVPPERRGIVDMIAALAEQENRSALGITYSGFALTALPHKRLPDDQPWQRQGHRIRLLVEPGRLPDPKSPDGFRLYGVPYGSRARMIMFYLQSEAVRTRSREIEIGRSMHDWLDRMGISIGGQGYKDVREQAMRISACRMTFASEVDIGGARANGFSKGQIVDEGLQFSFATTSGDPRQPSLWQDVVVLNEKFYRELLAHPVPLWEPALKQLSSNSPAIDIYVWLAYRLHSLSEPTHITWLSLFEQFGAGYARLRDFRKRFQDNLVLALAVYEEARVEVKDDGSGVILYPSAPPIPEREQQHLLG
ncbi:MAG TPA: replication protein RepA [Azospirillum sp.]|nr:replication protein RepA [Azospirillum sp.]